MTIGVGLLNVSLYGPPSVRIPVTDMKITPIGPFGSLFDFHTFIYQYIVLSWRCESEVGMLKWVEVDACCSAMHVPGVFANCRSHAGESGVNLLSLGIAV